MDKNEKVLHPADQICAIMRRIYDADLTTLSGGNLSIMDGEGVMWVTPAGMDKAALRGEDIVRVLPDGTCEGKYKPTSEYRIHKHIYEIRPELKAIVHAHSPALVTMCALHMLPQTRLYPAVHAAVRELGLAEYATPGTPELVQRVGEVFRAGYDAAALKGHAVFFGSKTDLSDAFRRFEELDFSARLEIEAAVLGSCFALSPDELECFGALEQTVMVMEELAEYPHSPQESALREALGNIAKRAYAKRLFTGLNGVISARLPDENGFLITGACVDNAVACADDFVRIQHNKRERGRYPHPTATLHERIYAKNPDVQSIITAAPTFAATFGVTGKDYAVMIIPESYYVLRNCQSFPFEALFNDVPADHINLQHPFAIIQNYGILVAGKSPLQAFDRLEVSEFTARAYHCAKRMGKEITPMTRQQAEAVDRQYPAANANL